MRDVLGEVKGLHLLSPQVIASATTTNGTGIDVSKYQGLAKATLQLGALTGTQTADLTIQHSDVIGSGYTTLATFPQKANADANTTSEVAVDLRTAKKFVRASLVSAGTVTALNVGVTLHAHKTEKLPV